MSDKTEESKLRNNLDPQRPQSNSGPLSEKRLISDDTTDHTAEETADDTADESTEKAVEAKDEPARQQDETAEVEPEYLTGFKLFIVTACVTLVVFLLLLDTSIIATVSASSGM